MLCPQLVGGPTYMLNTSLISSGLPGQVNNNERETDQTVA